MKNASLYLLLFIFIFSSNKAFSQAKDSLNDKANHFSMGLQISSFGSDFGWGLNFTSPYFAKKRLAVRLSTQFHYYEHLDSNGTETVWSPYPAFKLGLVSTSNVLLDFLRLYSHTGVLIVVPNALFSDVPVAFGAYSKLGAEIMFSSNGKSWGSYFFEGGWIGLFTKANLLPGKPVYANGFVASTGVRFYF
jgi:hypothetical protein